MRRPAVLRTLHRVGLVIASLGALHATSAPGSPPGWPGMPRVVTLAEAHASGVAAEPAPLPERLSETGLYRADGAVDPHNRPYAPQYPLWTDGATKSRWIRLPAGARIDVRDVDAWGFPAGTVAWKEFAWDGHKVETRMIRAEADGRWTFATYVWNAEQTDAFLAPEDGVPDAYPIAAGRRHTIPGRADCLACHGSAPSRLLGFSALQLSDDRDPLAPHAEPADGRRLTLRTLVAEDRLAPARPELARRPPRIAAADPLERAARGYLSANCGHCHNARAPLARLGFAMLAEFAPPAPGTASVPGPVGAHTRYAIPGPGGDGTRAIAPGAPERSAVLHRMRSRRPSSQMPPLGTVVPDTVAIELVRRWITALGQPEDGALSRAVPGPHARRTPDR